MSESAVRVSVIIPTHNRRESLRRTLDALGRQSFPEPYEVIVAADGCVDDTAEMIKGYPAPFVLRLVEQPASGPGAARNAGASLAAGDILIFLDDDIEATSALIEAHVRAHEGRSDVVALGYLPTVLNGERGLFGANLRMWWENAFTPMRDAGYQFSYTNLLTGNFSIQREHFRQTGGFDTVLRAHEDYELGYRLLQAGARFVFVPEAKGFHHEKTDVRRSLARKFDEGRADVVLARHYPDLLPVLPVSRPTRGRRYWLIRRLILRVPKLTMVLARQAIPVLHLLEFLKMRRSWHGLLHLLQYGWYWRGVTEELPTSAARTAHLSLPPESTLKPECILDLREGLMLAEARLDERRPRAVTLYYGRHYLGDIHVPPGTENLRGAHLRTFLLTHFSLPLVIARNAERYTHGMKTTLPGGLVDERGVPGDLFGRL